MRLFVAIELPPDVQEGLARAQDRLRGAGADVSWVKPTNIHITLKFLGETDPQRLERIGPVLAQAARTVAPFSATVAAIGTFGGRVPRVVWAGVQDGATSLGHLAHAVDDGLVALGFSREKRDFAAHVTLGRVRSPRNVHALLAAVRAEPLDAVGRLWVDRFALMQSELHPSGSIYTDLERFLLGNN